MSQAPLPLIRHSGNVGMGPLLYHLLTQLIIVGPVTRNDQLLSDDLIQRVGGVCEELLPDVTAGDVVGNDVPRDEVLGRVHRGLKLRLEEDSQVVGEDDVHEEATKHCPDYIDKAGGCSLA